MAEYDSNRESLHVECPRCSLRFSRSLKWIHANLERKWWTCPQCHKRFNVELPEEARQPPPKPPPPPRQWGTPSKVAGVSHDNSDGTSRQAIIKRCREGEQLQLRREPDNPYDPNAVAIFRLTGEQLGYLTSHLAEDVASDLDAGATIPCCITEITGTGMPTRGVNIFLGDKLPVIDREAHSIIVLKMASVNSPKPEPNPSYGLVALVLLALFGALVAAAVFLNGLR